MTQTPAPPLAYEPPRRARGNTKRLASKLIDVGGQLAALAAVFAFFWWWVPNDRFATAGNLEGILIQSVVFIMAALGMTIIIITGGIDLAAGSTIALSMVMTAIVLRAGGGTDAPWYYTIAAVLAGTLSAAVVGLIEGALITGLRVVPFIITLGGLVGVRGFVKQIADNKEIYENGWLYDHLLSPVQTGHGFNWRLFPIGVWGTLLAAILAAGMLGFTKLGRHVYAIGSSEATARLCGIPVQRTKIMVYAIGGLFTGLAGVLEYSRLGLGQPTGGASYELYVIAACVIGGASLRGGIGTIFGTVVGALIIGILHAGCDQAGWQNPKQEMVIGATIIIAVAVDQVRNRRTSRA